MFIIGQRVMTKYGTGTVAHFEHIAHVNKPMQYVSTYTHGDRIGVTLDNPENWPLSHTTNKQPYFVPADLTPIN